jgi:tRNA A37 threonylcarbamoyladenosine biosynthesis protein TsaE
VNEYERANGPQLVHLDFYRLESEMALEEVGFLDLMALPAVLAIEWGNRFPRSLPRDHVQVEIQRGTVAPGEVDSSTGSAGGANHEQQIEETSPRIFNVMATGERSLEVASVWREALGAVARTFTIP